MTPAEVLKKACAIAGVVTVFDYLCSVFVPESWVNNNTFWLDFVMITIILFFFCLIITVLLGIAAIIYRKKEKKTGYKSNTVSF